MDDSNIDKGHHMWKMTARNKRVTLTLITTLTSISLVSILFGNVGTSNIAFAMGDNPSSCSNLYDSTITSLKITIGGRTIDPIAHPNTNFSAKLGQGYTVTVTLHSAGVSNSGNTDTGSVWYGSTAYGFASDHCVYGVNPNSDVTITLSNVFMGQATHGTVQSVEWYSWPFATPNVAYTVHWY
jgi:hypothetical protein